MIQNRQMKVYLNVIYKKTPEKDLAMDLFYPKGTSGRLPAVIFFHGGGWFFGSKEAHLENHEFTTSRGFISIHVGYRLVNEAIFPAAVQDVRDAVHFIRRNADELNIDANNLFTWGDSAGGHLSMICALCRNDALFADQGDLDLAAAASWFGVSSLFDDNFLHHQEAHKFTDMVTGGKGTEHIDLLKSCSPVTYVKKGNLYPPTLLLHGNCDPLVDFHQSVNLHRLLLEAGAESHLEIIQGAGHGFPDFFDRLEQTLDFFKEHIR